MAGDLPGFLTREGDALVFNGEGEFIFYVPEKFFDTKNAEILGEYVRVIGIMDYAIFDKNGKNSGLKQFRLPTQIITRPYTIEKLKQVQLTKYSPVQDYRALKYKKGDYVLANENVAQDVENIEAFYRLIIWGNMPNTIPYDELQNYYIENADINGASYGVNIQLIGVTISESYRDINDPSVPFRLSGSKDMHAYRHTNIRDIAKYTSPFASITSENWDDAVVGAITVKGHKESPMEKILMT